MLAVLSGVLLHRLLPDLTLIPSSLTTSCEPSSQRAPIPKVDGILYWVKFGDCNDLVVHAYDLYNDDCFEGTLNMLQEVFGKREYLYQSCMASPPGLIHLCDHKFCLPLQSWTRNEKNRDMRHYFLYCVVLNISPIFDDGNEELHNDIRDLFNPKKLHVSVLSSERYPMDHGVKILDTFLLRSHKHHVGEASHKGDIKRPTTSPALSIANLTGDFCKSTSRTTCTIEKITTLPLLSHGEEEPKSFVSLSLRISQKNAAFNPSSSILSLCFEFFEFQLDG
ncbi:hypothetical protein CMV_013880 [Castanea mollissima]|uniref:Uncharacterized protein n=1 Tax=Castanea mollissima TaxID=60419 RepID=A0A8J4RCZ5_9ROSI|nr:hypothetical protein CMV_013880 [Castanea mollissima]